MQHTYSYMYHLRQSSTPYSSAVVLKNTYGCMCNDSLLLGQNGLYACLENTLINTCFDKYMYRYVGHVSAIERSDLDQGLCRKRPTVAARERSTIRCGVRWMCLTLLVSFDSVGVSLGRARVVSLRGVLFSFLVKISKFSIRTYGFIQL